MSNAAKVRTPHRFVLVSRTGNSKPSEPVIMIVSPVFILMRVTQPCVARESGRGVGVEDGSAQQRHDRGTSSLRELCHFFPPCGESKSGRDYFQALRVPALHSMHDIVAIAGTIPTVRFQTRTP